MLLLLSSLLLVLLVLFLLFSFSGILREAQQRVHKRRQPLRVRFAQELDAAGHGVRLFGKWQNHNIKDSI